MKQRTAPSRGATANRRRLFVFQYSAVCWNTGPASKPVFQRPGRQCVVACARGAVAQPQKMQVGSASISVSSASTSAVGGTRS